MLYVKQTWKGIENLQYTDENQVIKSYNNLLFVIRTLFGLGKSDCNHIESNSQMVLTLGDLRQEPQSQGTNIRQTWYWCHFLDSSAKHL